MLSALGWDVSDPDLVEIEPSIGSGWADYALLDASKKPVMLVEAKKLADKDADGALSQSSGYLMTHNRNNSHKIIYCAWTNGDKWEVVDVTKQESVMKETLTERGTTPIKFALRFLGLWCRSLQDGSFEAAVQPLIEVEGDAALGPISHVEVAPTPQPILSQATTQPSTPAGVGWTPLTEDFETTNRPAPTAIRFPNGEERELRHWRGIVTETVTWLYQRGILANEERQFRSGPKRYLFNLDGRHPNGGRFKQPIALGEAGIVVEGNISSYLSVRSTRRLLAQLSQDPSQVYLKL